MNKKNQFKKFVFKSVCFWKWDISYQNYKALRLTFKQNQ